MRAVRSRLWSAVALLAVVTSVQAQDLASFEKRTTVRKLDNGLTVIIMERPEAPVFSFATVVNTGSAQEVAGITGLAHMFEHMAFKGNDVVGTTDWNAEEKALAKVEETYLAYDHERRKEVGRDDQKVKQLEKSWRDAIAAADKFVVTDEFSKLVERNVVMEERRLAMDQPIQRLVEQFIATAYIAHPYQHPVLGFWSDLQSFSMTDAEAFYRTYYAPRNLITAVVGDIDADTLVPILEKYFGRIPAGPPPPPLRTVEPPQTAEKRVVLQDPSQPFYLEGYHKPASTDPDQPVYDAIDDILSNGRTSRLYRALVRDKRLAVFVASFSGFPGEKYPNLWAAYAVPARGVGNEQVQAAIHEEIERLKTADVSDEELTKFKTRAKADLLRRLGNNLGLAEQLASYQRLYGDWRELFRSIDRLDKVTKADIRRVATAALIPATRTVAIIETVAPGGQP